MGAFRVLAERGVEVPTDALQRASVEPPYFDALAETVARMLRRPRDAQRLLRYFEWWGQGEIGLGAVAVDEALGAAYGEYTRKLVTDIVRMCFGAANLDKEWLGLVTGAAARGAEAKANRGATDPPTGQAAQLPLER